MNTTRRHAGEQIIKGERIYMKRWGLNLAMMIWLSSAVCLVAWADGTKTNGHNKAALVTFKEDVLVNERLVKQGVYRVLFNADANRLTILNKNGSIAATVKVNVKPSTDKALEHAVFSVSTPRGQVMTALVFAGEQRRLATATAAGDNSAGGAVQ